MKSKNRGILSGGWNCLSKGIGAVWTVSKCLMAALVIFVVVMVSAMSRLIHDIFISTYPR